VKSWSPYAVLVVVAIALDQWVKHLVETGLAFQEKIDLVPFLALYRTYNTGIAFSMFSSFGDTGLVVSTTKPRPWSRGFGCGVGSGRSSPEALSRRWTTPGGAASRPCGRG